MNVVVVVVVALLLVGSEAHVPTHYRALQSSRNNIDNAAFESAKFWAEIDAHLPGWRQSADMARFRGFCNNLQSKPPDTDIMLANGQQLLEQYVYPGLDGSERCAYPSKAWAELAALEVKLETDVAPVARLELEGLLAGKPLASDDDAEWRPAAAREERGDGWQLAAWPGWQYLSFRAARGFMPLTTRALQAAVGSLGLGPAHRFVGLARQKAASRGTVHSDGRNYMLSTLTPVKAPPGRCGIVVDGIDAPLTTDGPAVVLDNTFPHYIYNDDAHQDRFCIIAEVWHPALRATERAALATLFALKDRFTVLDLQLAPWGYTDDDLQVALQNGAVNDLRFWRDIDVDPRDLSSTKAAAKSTGKKVKKSARGFGRKTKK